MIRALLTTIMLALVATSVAGASIPRWSAVATPKHRVVVRARPNGKIIHRFSTKNTFLVQGQFRMWTRVYLPTRPNGSKGWIRTRDLNLRRDNFFVQVRLKLHKIFVYRSGHLILSNPVGVGRAVLPTPRGLYYIVETLKLPNPAGAYGPYAFGLSAHSNVLHEFHGGDGQVGLHGTDYPAGIGHDVSHGCIRMRNWVIAKLAHLLPLGTPVRISA
jgi:lipoprotein-anchoring transpeptidase ErfK/SrfK